MEPQPIEELPRIPIRISLNPELDPHVEILEFEVEEDHNGRTISIKQRRRESEQLSEASSKEKGRNTDADSSQSTISQCLPSEDQRQAPTEKEQVQAQREERPPAPEIALVDYPDEEPSTGVTADDSALPDQTRPIEET